MSERLLSQGLDYYKATMSQVEHEKLADAQVTFELKNRSSERLSDYCPPDELRARLDALQAGWSADEIAYLASLQNQATKQPQFSAEFLDYLADNSLPDVKIGLDESGELTVKTTGPAPLVTFWETVIMSEINELYFENKLPTTGSSLEELYREGDQRLSDKIERLKARPDILFSDFGTRRRFSFAWQEHVVERVARELPENFVGTSNIYLAHKLGVKPIGTFAHELPMIYGALEEGKANNPLLGHNKVLRDWQDMYDGDLSTALTDTFTSEFFFTDFTPEQALDWKALRHDSGDPFEFGERVIQFYEDLGIDPHEKTLVFSDGLDIGMILSLADRFKGRIQLMFGWGTTLTNDLGIRANNFVMKAVEVNGIPTVKLSDVDGKHTGPEAHIEFYKSKVQEARSLGALAWQHSCQPYAQLAVVA